MEQQKHINCWWEDKMIVISEELGFSLQNSTLSLCNPAGVLISIYPNELKTSIDIKTFIQMLYGSSVYNCQNLEATKMLFSREMDK